jgi:trimethylamine--corrinoid protein Co-methyltransferase
MRRVYRKIQLELYHRWMFTNTMPRYEPLAPEAIELVERGWKRLVSEIGVQFDEPRALELFRAAGQTVEGDLVRFDPEFVLEQVAKAPSEFTVYARNPEHDLQIGGDRMMFIPAQGPPFVRIGAERRDGTLADLVSFIKLAQMAPELDTPGGNICEPDDVPLDSRHLVQTLALIVHSDKIFKGMPMSRTASEDSIRMGEILAGGRELLEQRPVMFANVNVNSPLRYDVRMLEAMLAYSAAGQPVIVTPFLLMGAMAPVTIPSALAQQMAEVLTGIALVQLIRPGAPCVMGSFLSAIDMQSGSPSFGGPESVLGLYASGQIARRYGLPWRAGGGTLTASQSVDAQAAYESLNTLLAAFMAGANVVYQSAGWLESGLVTCFEKFALDIELLQLLRRQFTPVTFDEDALAFSAHAEIGPGGYFLGAEHTLQRFRECFWRPALASTENFERWKRNGSHDACDRAGVLWREALERYEQPPLDEAVHAELSEFVERRTRELGDDLFPLPGAA